MRYVFSLILVVFVLFEPNTPKAQIHSETYNGGFCTDVDQNQATRDEEVLDFSNGGDVACQFTIPNGFTIRDIESVSLNGLVDNGAGTAGPMRLRLCIYSAVNFGNVCGTEFTIAGDGRRRSVNLTPPTSFPSGARGGFVDVTFPPSSNPPRIGWVFFYAVRFVR